MKETWYCDIWNATLISEYYRTSRMLRQVDAVFDLRRNHYTLYTSIFTANLLLLARLPIKDACAWAGWELPKYVHTSSFVIDRCFNCYTRKSQLLRESLAGKLALAAYSWWFWWWHWGTTKRDCISTTCYGLWGRNASASVQRQLHQCST